MNKPVKYWIALLLLPLPLYASMYFLGLIGLAGYLGYYRPLWFLGDTFFTYSTDIGWYFPTIYGNLIGAIIYSLIYWFGYKAIIKYRSL